MNEIGRNIMTRQIFAATTPGHARPALRHFPRSAVPRVEALYAQGRQVVEQLS